MRRKLYATAVVLVGLASVGLYVFFVNRPHTPQWKYIHIIGRVVSKKGLPVAGAYVHAIPLATYVDAMRLEVVRKYKTDAQGRFTIYEIPGKYQMYAEARHCPDAFTIVSAQSGQTVTTKILLHRDPPRVIYEASADAGK